MHESNPQKWIVCAAAWIVLSLLAAAPTAFGHEFWIEPASFRPPVDSVLAIGLRVGDGFPGQPVVRDREGIDRFVMAGPGETRPVAGWDGRHPAGLTRVTEPGVHVIVYESRPVRIELDAAKFESYLREDGLERIIELRADRGESSSPGRERYRRCAKSVVRVGDADPADDPANDRAGADRVLGLPLELVPEPDGKSFRLLYRGKPCEGVMVGARHRPRPGHLLRSRTDAEGRVSFDFDEPGPWLVSGVHMVAAPDDDADADWHSYWASLSFER